MSQYVAVEVRRKVREAFGDYCAYCNRFKSDRTHGKLTNENVARLFHPQQDDWSEHFDWSIDGTVIAGLTEIGAATVNLLRMNRPQVVDVRSLWIDAGRHPPN